jgi:hypothetical protein
MSAFCLRFWVVVTLWLSLWNHHFCHSFAPTYNCMHVSRLWFNTDSTTSAPRQWMKPNNIHDESTGTTVYSSTTHTTRRTLFLQTTVLLSMTVVPTLPQTTSQAAPPIAIIAEELGYFPVRNRLNETVYIPKRIQRPSSDQAMALAERMVQQQRVMVYVAYWCPHCARQRELWGRQAWGLLQSHGMVLECAPQGYEAQPFICATKQIDGYPTWVIQPKGAGANPIVFEGERTLSVLAEAVGFVGWDDSLEANVPPLVGQACTLRK